MLTGQYTKPSDFEEGDFRRINPRFSEEVCIACSLASDYSLTEDAASQNFPKNLRAAEAISGIAKRKGCTAGQLTLAWLLAQDPLVIPIPGTKKIKYLEENVKALDVHVSKEESLEVRKALEGATAQGSRYPEAMLSALFADTPPL
jgi:aryl-alcohol dehydrogenase-like predicted oxidoreductase